MRLEETQERAGQTRRANQTTEGTGTCRVARDEGSEEEALLRAVGATKPSKGIKTNQ